MIHPLYDHNSTKVIAKIKEMPRSMIVTETVSIQFHRMLSVVFPSICKIFTFYFYFFVITTGIAWHRASFGLRRFKFVQYKNHCMLPVVEPKILFVLERIVKLLELGSNPFIFVYTIKYVHFKCMNSSKGEIIFVLFL